MDRSATVFKLRSGAVNIGMSQDQRSRGDGVTTKPNHYMLHKYLCTREYSLQTAFQQVTNEAAVEGEDMARSPSFENMAGFHINGELKSKKKVTFLNWVSQPAFS